VNGHGSKTSLFGYENELLFDMDDAASGCLNECVVHSLSCNAGAKLGAHIVSAGAAAFIGYDDKFIFMYYDDNREMESYFLEPAYEVVHAFLKGESILQSYQASQKKYGAKILQAISANIDSNCIANIYHDMTHQVHFGKESMTIHELG
jgi:hypothetical protein